MREYRLDKKGKLLVSGICLTLLVLLVLWAFPFFVPSGYSVNETVIMNTTVNITNAAPEIRGNVVLDDPIDLVAYGNKTVYCNATVFDWDNDTLTVNATLYITGITGPSSSDDGNNHYSVSNCTRLTPQNREMNYSCNFTMFYWADNSSNWECNMTVIDPDGALNSNTSNTAKVNPLVAIYAPGIIDYGELMVNEISGVKLANITNAGNRKLNLSVEGWGETQGDGWAMNCTYGHIDVQYERYKGTNETWANMYELTNESVMIPSFWIDQRTNETAEMYNATYWRLQIPPFAGGVCNGKILFTAQDFVG